MGRVLVMVMLAIVACAGCSLPSRALDNNVNASATAAEPGWIRNGEPIDFEKAFWYPTDEVERLMDNEVFQVGQYRDTAVFVERVDVKPYARVYTRFGKGRYRAFEPQG